MAIEWDMAAVIAAVAIFMMPYTIMASKGVRKAVQRRRRHYVCLQWSDIPEGRIHQCFCQGAWCQYFSHLMCSLHQPGKKLWEPAASLGSCFNRAWELSTRRPRYAKSIPDALPVESQFLCTDARTVLAFALCTVEERKSPYWYARSLSFGCTRIKCNTLSDGTTVAHIQGSIKNGNSAMLTKAELERLLSGYPPWYRENFTTRTDITLPFPMTSERDIPRAGWIIAVGLMSCGPKRHAPLGLYTCLDEPDKPAWRQNGRMFRQAVVRCRDHIRENFAPRFPGNQDVADAIRALNSLIDKLTGSGTPSGNLGVNAAVIDQVRTLPHLRYSDCKFVCDNFNDYRELDTSATARFEPILFPVMAAAVHGAYEVVQYLKDDGMELKIPPELLPLDREVWLRDSATTLPIK